MGCASSIPVPGAEGLTLDKIIEGLKAALEKAAEVATEQLGGAGGFANSEALRIKIPGDLGKVMDKCRSIGLGDKVDDLENKMNEAAESACGVAVDVFKNAITNMSFEDAKAILEGENNAATEYFDKLCRGDLTEKFSPIITEKMTETGCIEVFDEVKEKYNKIPMVSDIDFDLVEYVNTQALDGLFSVFAEKEADIRENPGGQGSAIIGDVFGSVGK